MKRNFITLILCMFTICVLTVNCNAQSDPRIYVILQSSKNCEVCNDNFSRWNSDVYGYYSQKDPSIVFINYDATDDNTRAASKKDLDRYGIGNISDASYGPGSIIVVDAATKQVIGTSSMDAGTKDIRKLIGE